MSNVSVFGQDQAGVRGSLIASKGDCFLYANQQILNTEGGVVNIQAGSSYTVVTDEEIIAIDFESSHGAGDGLSFEVLLQMLSHHAKASFDDSSISDALEQAKQSLNEYQCKNIKEQKSA